MKNKNIKSFLACLSLLFLFSDQVFAASSIKDAIIDFKENINLSTGKGGLGILSEGKENNEEEKQDKEAENIEAKDREFEAVLNFEEKEDSDKKFEDLSEEEREKLLAKKRNEERIKKMQEIQKIESFFKKYQNSVLEDIYEKLINSKDEYIEIQQKEGKTSKRIKSLREEMTKHQEEIDMRSEKIDTLEGQLKNLTRSIAMSAERIRNVEKQIARIQGEIEVLVKRINQKRVELDVQKELLNDYIKAIYLEESQFYDFSSDEVGIIQLTFADISVGEILRERDYLSEVETVGRDIFKKIEKIKQVLEDREVELSRKYSLLEKLNKDLSEEHKMMTNLKEARENLLAKTRNEKDSYKKLYEKSRSQKMDATREIESLLTEKNKLKTVIESLEERKRENEEIVESIKGQAQKAFSFGIFSKLTDEDFMWPIDPYRGITAYYHDPTYKSAFGVEHQAIDIRAYQGTEIYSPAEAYVLKAKDNGFGYSYIVLAHPNDYFTVYGHVSKFLVKDGDLVKKGDVIGLTGGIPGTRGAGWMTTGPHLHFEIYKGGEHVDPLSILPLEYLPISYIPDKWVYRLDLDDYEDYWNDKLVKRYGEESEDKTEKEDSELGQEEEVNNITEPLES